MNCLLIDVGNTHLKWGLDSGSVFSFGGKCRCQPELDDSLFIEQVGDINPEYVFISCVGSDTVKQRLTDLVRARWGIEVELLKSPAQECGITNAYKLPNTLGSDRWAAMVAAFEQARGAVCVVDSGTAVTLDIVNNEGIHLGGLIIPGVGLMQSCLQQGACIDFDSGFPSLTRAKLGQSTASCIQQGSILAVSGMVSTMLTKFNADLAGISLVLTGGDAELLQSQLDSHAYLEPHLVLKGLASILRSRLAVDKS